MFSYRKFDVEIDRRLAVERLSWPGRGEADDESSLGLNRSYMDLRGYTWAEAKQAFEAENELIVRLETSADPENEYYAIEDEIYDHLYCLDLGMASTVLALSAAKCIPFSSCNAGALDGGHHNEHYPVVAFYARPAIAEIILTCVEEAQIGLEMSDQGFLVAYADDIRAMRRFATVLMENKKLRASRTSRKVKTNRDSGQGSLF
jgi:hypothetical protein